MADVVDAILYFHSFSTKKDHGARKGRLVAVVEVEEEAVVVRQVCTC